MLTSRVELIIEGLERDGQDPRREDDYDGCAVISAKHRDPRRFGRFDIYVAPGGAWTHSRARAKQLAERFPVAT
jgi:hypothetical protein